jgi:hypothetical protein
MTPILIVYNQWRWLSRRSGTDAYFGQSRMPAAIGQAWRTEALDNGTLRAQQPDRFAIRPASALIKRAGTSSRRSSLGLFRMAFGWNIVHLSSHKSPLFPGMGLVCWHNADVTLCVRYNLDHGRVRFG